MTRSHRIHGALLLLALVVGACGGSSPAASSGTAGGSGSSPASAPSSDVGASSGPVEPSGPVAGGSGEPVGGSGGSAGGVTDLCTVFTDGDITTFLGRAAHGTGPQAATTAANCTWSDDSLTTVWVLKADPDTCASDQAAIGSAGASYPGTDFAGPSQLGATFAGVVSGGTCYEVEVTPTERSPKPDAVAALLQQFVQRVGG